MEVWFVEKDQPSKIQVWRKVGKYAFAILCRSLDSLSSRVFSLKEF